jgi:predicted acyl esterase
MISQLLRYVCNLPPPAFSVDRVQDLQAPMRDGVNLLTDISTILAARGSRPRRSCAPPYGRGGSLLAPIARAFAEQGYATVIQSVRGTFGSGVEF